MAVFVVPESKAAKADGQFQFKLPGSKKTFNVPLMQYLPVERASAAARFESGAFNPTDLDAVLADMFGSEELAGLVKKLDSEQLSALFQAWQDAGDVSLGESPASED